jgi:hypothetical protein
VRHSLSLKAASSTRHRAAEQTPPDKQCCSCPTARELYWGTVYANGIF